MKKVFPSNKGCTKNIESHSGYEMFKARIDALTLLKPNDVREALKIYAELESLVSVVNLFFLCCQTYKKFY